MRTEKLKLIKELSDNKVECEDLDGLRWIVSNKAYKRFRNTGFLFLPKSINIKFQNILNGRDFGKLSKPERFNVMVRFLEATTNESIGNLFPNLANIKSELIN